MARSSVPDDDRLAPTGLRQQGLAKDTCARCGVVFETAAGRVPLGPAVLDSARGIADMDTACDEALPFRAFLFCGTDLRCHNLPPWGTLFDGGAKDPETPGLTKVDRGPQDARKRREDDDVCGPQDRWQAIPGAGG